MLLLWDIDGTLVEGLGVGRRAMVRTFAKLFGIADAFADIVMSGKVDPSIFREAVKKNGIEGWPDHLPLIQETYLQELAQAMIETPVRVNPGILESLNHLRHKGYLHALGTGNLQQGAHQKMQSCDLLDYFPTGGFADGLFERNAVIARAKTISQRHYNLSADYPTLVIGDTPRDVEAAHVNGMPCLALASSRFSVADLQEVGADWVMEEMDGHLADGMFTQFFASLG